jgi:hypothetical protein
VRRALSNAPPDLSKRFFLMAHALLFRGCSIFLLDKFVSLKELSAHLNDAHVAAMCVDFKTFKSPADAKVVIDAVPSLRFVLNLADAPRDADADAALALERELAGLLAFIFICYTLNYVFMCS